MGGSAMSALLPAYRDGLSRLLAEVDARDVDGIASVLRSARIGNRRVYVCGNGGSAANASHLTLHLSEVGLRAHDLSADLPILTALANDVGYEKATLRRLRSLAEEGDTLIVISGSGDSPNILTALAEARRIGMTTIGLLGFGGGAAHNLCDRSVTLDSRDYGDIEDCHSFLVHSLKRELASV